jgi:hypothetical protein
MQRSKTITACPLSVKSRHMHCKNHVCFTPESDTKCVFSDVHFGSLADKPSRAEIQQCPLLSESGQMRCRSFFIAEKASIRLAQIAQATLLPGMQTDAASRVDVALRAAIDKHRKAKG